MMSALYVGERRQQFNNHLSLNNLLSSQTLKSATKRSEEEEIHQPAARGQTWL